MSVGAYLVGLLTAEVNLKNIKALFRFLEDRLSSKPIELHVESPDGRSLHVKASSREEFEKALRAAQEFAATSDSDQDDIVLELNEKGRNYLKYRETAQRFFEQAGLRVADQDQRSLFILSVPEGLRLLPPISVLIVEGALTKEDVLRLVKKSRQQIKSGYERSGILLYQDPPDTVVRMRIAEARLEDDFMIIPVPFAEAESALLDGTCEAVLVEYVSRYIKRADFFDDKNAISDTVSFFGRIELLNLLKEELLSYQGVGLFGLRKSGKTSILYQLSFLLRKHPVIRIDLQQYPGVSYGADLFNDFLRQLLTFVKSKFPDYSPNFENFTSGTPASELTDAFIQRVCDFGEVLKKTDYELPILCFLDEVERILPNPSHPKEKVEEFNACLGALRALCQPNYKKLALLVADVHPDCNRINYWAHEGVATNPVFSFFKEVFLHPFSEEETVEMLNSIGEFMGLKFDDQTPQEIYKESGGHPFIARQLARFLTKAVLANDSRTFEWSALKGNLENLLFDFDELSNFFEKSVWEDLEKRNFGAAIYALKMLASTEKMSEWVKSEVLLSKLSSSFTIDQTRKALNWLIEVGILEQKQVTGNSSYRIRILHLSRWIRMQMTSEEIRQWQIC